MTHFKDLSEDDKITEIAVYLHSLTDEQGQLFFGKLIRKFRDFHAHDWLKERRHE
jgi:hypothetical protein